MSYRGACHHQDRQHRAQSATAMVVPESETLLHKPPVTARTLAAYAILLYIHRRHTTFEMHGYSAIAQAKKTRDACLQQMAAQNHTHLERRQIFIVTHGVRGWSLSLSPNFMPWFVWCLVNSSVNWPAFAPRMRADPPLYLRVTFLSVPLRPLSYF